ncbi:MAG: hypothetical protein AAFW46_18935, partial [Pseudomonadota bacterium]
MGRVEFLVELGHRLLFSDAAARPALRKLFIRASGGDLRLHRLDGPRGVEAVLAAAALQLIFAQRLADLHRHLQHRGRVQIHQRGVDLLGIHAEE